MSLPPVIPLTSDHYGVYHGDTWGPHVFQLSRIVSDAIAVGGGDAHLRSDTAVFTADDVGIGVVFLKPDGTIDPAQPAGLTIITRTDASHVILSGGITGAIDGYQDNYVMINRRDLTGCTSVVGSIRAEPQDTTEKASITGAIVGAPTAGRISLAMASGVTELIDAAGTMFYDVQTNFPSAVKRTVMRGPVEIVWDVQRP